MTLHRLIAGDLRAKARWNYGRADWRAMVRTLLTDGTGAMVLYRVMQWATRHRVAPLALLCNKVNAIVNNCIIGRGADFGPRFVLIHATGIVINSDVRGGSDVHLEHQVTIGASERRAPVLGNGVFVGAGAKIIGSVRVGNDVRVGANAVVVRDAPDHTTVVGIPARVVRRRAAGTGARAERSAMALM